MSQIARRLGRLEQTKQVATVPAIIFSEHGETTEDAVARRFPGGVPAGVKPLVVSWVSPADAEARGLA